MIPIRVHYEQPHTAFDIYDEVLTRDPGDGLGGCSTLQYLLREDLQKALKGNKVAIKRCLKRLHERECERLRMVKWPSRRPPLRPENHQAQSVASFLVMIGLATKIDPDEYVFEKKLGMSRGDYRIRFKPWVIQEALARIENPYSVRRAIEYWQKESAEHRSAHMLDWD